MHLELVIDAGFDYLKDHPVGMLYLPVGFRVIHRCPVHPDVPGVAKVEEFASYKLSAIINAVRNLEPVDDVLDELRSALGLEDGDGLNFDPFGEFVDGDQEVVEPPRGPPEISNHVKAPDCKWPGDRDGLEHLRRQVDLAGEILAPLEGPDEVLGIGKGRRPAEAMPKGLVDEGSRGGMVPVDASMDVEEQSLPVVWRDTLEEDPRRAAYRATHP